MQRTGDFTPAVTYSLPCGAGSGTVGPQMESLLGATGQPALGHVSQAASGWCVQWKASVGPKGEGVGEARETRPSPDLCLRRLLWQQLQTSPQRPSFLS